MHFDLLCRYINIHETVHLRFRDLQVKRVTP